jgi:hypothetical protein
MGVNKDNVPRPKDRRQALRLANQHALLILHAGNNPGDADSEGTDWTATGGAWCRLPSANQ